MAKQANTVFLEDWLISLSVSSSSQIRPSHPSPSSARAIIQAWSELRDSVQCLAFQPHHLLSLKTLLNSQTSLHVADPQAKLIISILSSTEFSLPKESYPLFLRILYIWARKSLRPSSFLVDSIINVVSNFFSTRVEVRENPLIFSESVVLLGALSSLPSASESSRILCIELLVNLLEEEYRAMKLNRSLVPNVLAGIGFVLSSSINVYYVRILDFLIGIWNKADGPAASVSHGLMILHLIEWVISGSIKSNSLEKLRIFKQVFSETSKENYAPFAILMAAAGLLRALAFNRLVMNNELREISLELRISAEDSVEYVANDLIRRTKRFGISSNHATTSLLLQCIALALSRSGLVSSRAPFFICIAYALLTEIYPLRRFYSKILEFSTENLHGLDYDMLEEHLESVIFKEAGAITGVLCNQYGSIDEESKCIVENLIWEYCRDIYTGHRQAALILRGGKYEYLRDVEKIAESAFLTIVVFAFAVTKYRLNSKHALEDQMVTSVKILVSFSCIEYFRRIRLAEYMDTIRGVIVSVQENEPTCVSFVESMPTYRDMTTGPVFLWQQKMKYLWAEDEVQTARMLFYLRVIPTCIDRLPSPIFRKMVVSTMFLYIGHPNGKVARASHSTFVAFISGKDIDEERILLKEETVFFYVERSLSGYPGITPFEGMASGIVAVVRHLPAGSTSIFYCIDSLIEKVNRLCRDDFGREGNMWKSWQGDSEPSKKILDLLLRLLSIVDIQVLPTMMKSMARLILQLPIEGQNMVLNELYSLVAESDDVTRKPLLVSWLQSLSYISNSTNKSEDFDSKKHGSRRFYISEFIGHSMNRIRHVARL